MKTFQTLSYVFGLFLAVVIVAGLGAKEGKSDPRGSRGEMCDTRPESGINCSKSTSGSGTVLDPDYDCTDKYNGKVDGEYATNVVSGTTGETQCNQFTDVGILGVHHCNPESEYTFSDDCVPTCR